MRRLLNTLRSLITFRRVRRWVVIAIALWILLSVGLVFAVHFFGQARQSQQTDVIIVLGSGLRRNGSPGDALWRRSLWGAARYHEGLAPAVLCTGGQAEGQWRSEADACAEILREEGVPEDAIYLEKQSRSTEENALFSAEIMAQQGWEDALLVTDSFHSLRSHWIFNMTGITNYPNPVPSSRVRFYWYAQLLSREILALHWQAFKEVFNIPVTHVSIG